MRVSTQVQVSHKEIQDAVIEVAKKAAGVSEPGSASVRFICDEPNAGPIQAVTFSAQVEFVKAGHS